ALRLRQALALIEGRLDGALAGLADLAQAHAETPMMARTYGQPATVTTFGAHVAIWGEGLLAVRAELPAIRDGVCQVTLSGAAGTLAAMGPEGPALRAALAAALGLRDPEASPHAERAGVRALASWCQRVLQAVDKAAVDLLLWTRDGTVTLGGGGASSTMPQKQNPVGPSVMRALAGHGAGLAATLQGATPAEARDGAAWFTEWLSLPPLVAATGKALSLLGEAEVAPDLTALRKEAEDPSGMIHAEAVSFRLAQDIPREAAQAQVKAWVAEVRAEGGSLLTRAGLDAAEFAPERQWGEAPALARRFAAKVRGHG
ncbi:MAG: lyase family protein, partial [Pseudomonadota bacterium]